MSFYLRHPARWRQVVAAVWNSERVWPFRFYLGYLRWPLLFLVLAIAGDKVIYYGVLPLSSYVTREFHYFVAVRQFHSGQEQAAMFSIRSALLHTRDNSRFWELAAQISDRIDSPEAAYCWQQVDRLQPDSFSTEMCMAESALHHHQFDLATKALQSVQGNNQTQLRFKELAGELFLATGQSAQARRFFEEIEATHPTDEATLFALAKWHAHSAEPGELDRARAILMTSPLSGQSATLRLLIEVDLQRHDLKSAIQASDAILQSSDATFADRVTRLDLVGSGIDAALADLMKTENRDEIIQVVHWMVTHERAEAALIWIRTLPEEAQNDPIIGYARADCLAALGLWEHLESIQIADRWPEHETERWMILARACFAQQHEADGRAAWKSAVLSCQNYSDYLMLLRYAVQDEGAEKAFHAWDDQKTEVWLALADHYPDQIWVLKALLHDSLARKDLVRAEEIYAHLMALDPLDLTLRARSALLSLLRGRDLEKNSIALRDGLLKEPNNPVVATAAAYDLYRRGDFNQALMILGGLTPLELEASERALYVGALLAAGGSTDQAKSRLQVALTQPGLLDEEQALADRSLNLVAYRQAMTCLLQTPAAASTPLLDNLFTVHSQAEDGGIFNIGQSVALERAGKMNEARCVLAEVDPGQLDNPALSIYVGGILYLMQNSQAACPYLELANELPPEDSKQKLHRALESWWALQTKSPRDGNIMGGLFATYRALKNTEGSISFWQHDAERELYLVRTALLYHFQVDAAQERLSDLVQHVRSTPEMEAQFAYSLLLQGRLQAAHERMQSLSEPDLQKPEPSLYYGLILRACGNKEEAHHYLNRAIVQLLPSEELALVTKTDPGR